MLFRKTFRRFLVLIISILLSSTTYYLNGQTKAYAKASWIVDVNPDTLWVELDTDSFGGYYYLLVDIQENIAEETLYCHYIIKLINSNGVQEMSDISIDYDPSFQSLAIHEVNRFRKGVKTDELLNHDFKTIQRESEMNRFLYDGSLTSYTNLEDVREGDIIEYSFSVKGFNPTNKGQYFRAFNLEYYDPVKMIYRRIITSKKTKLFFNYPSGRTEPEVQETSNNRIYTWQSTDVKAHIYDNNVPSWYDDNVRVEISTLNTWSGIVNLSLGDYQITSKERAIIKDSALEMFGNNFNDSILITIIRFVQDEIRYLGFESGVNAYKPTPPSAVLKSRFADCKAKSLLLCSLLQQYGIECYPVLVSSDKIKSDTILLPSRDAFDHVVVQIIFDGQAIYVDPTLSSQGGDIFNNYFPPYGYGLILKEGSSKLSYLTNGCKSETRVTNFLSLDSIGGPAILKIVSEYTGYYADDIRSSYKYNSIEETSKSYLKFYSKSYPLIKIKEPLEYSDDRKTNVFVVEEEYLIDSLWTPVDGDSNKITMSTSALIINSAVSIASSPERRMPYSISYPSDFTEDIYIELPIEWDITTKTIDITDSVFSFLFKVDSDEERIHLHYNYKTFSDHQTAGGFKEFYSRHGKIADYLVYNLNYSRNASNSTNFSWILGYLYLIILSVSTLFALKIYKGYNLPTTALAGKNIGGWLIVVAFGLAVSTIRVASNLYFDGNFFLKETWTNIFDSEQKIALFILVSFEFIYNSVLLVYLFLLQVMFYKRRNNVPRLLVIFYSVHAIVVIFDTFAAQLITPDSFSIEEKNESYIQIGQNIIYSLVWMTYVLKSDRVKNTFTTIYRKSINWAIPSTIKE